MAVLAVDACVAAQQREASACVVEARHALPVGFVMAGVAVAAELVRVLVVLAVAAIAFGLGLSRYRRAVWQESHLPRVPAEQRILRVASWTEVKSLPRAPPCAGFALGAVAALVLVVLAWQPMQVERRALEAPRFAVAIPAFDVAMLAGSGKRGVVVEACLAPPPLGVAVAASRAQRAVVLVVPCGTDAGR